MVSPESSQSHRAAGVLTFQVVPAAACVHVIEREASDVSSRHGYSASHRGH